MMFQNTNVFGLMPPGIYEISCISKKKVYIGESANLLARIGKHVSSLTQNNHNCKERQKNWNELGE
jgi:predicted GIY-YIG superfamily endonuclease